MKYIRKMQIQWNGTIYDKELKRKSFKKNSEREQNITIKDWKMRSRTKKVEGSTTTYQYNNMNQLTNDGTWAYTYDDNGNLVQKADGYNTFIYTYDYENRMTEAKWNGVTIQENFYDCCGRRIKMKNYNENGELTYTIIYIYIGWNTIYEKTIYPDLTETETKYIYGVSGHIAKITDTGTVETTTFYHTDHLGSVRQKTDSDGNSLWASYAIYKPFGGLYSGGPSDESETHLYTGKTYDYGTGLYYYGARFYDPEIGRFVTADPVKGGIGNPQSLNLYVYVMNNPLKFIDPAGMKIKKEITKEPPPPSDTDAEETTLNGDGEGGESELTPEELGKKMGYSLAGWIPPIGTPSVEALGGPEAYAELIAQEMFPNDPDAQQEFIEGFVEGYEKGKNELKEGIYDWSQSPTYGEVSQLMSDVLEMVTEALILGGFSDPFLFSETIQALLTLYGLGTVGEPSLWDKIKNWLCTSFGIFC